MALPILDAHPRGWQNPVDLRASAVLLGAGAWDAAPTESFSSGAHNLTLSFTYTRGAAGGAFDWQLEVSIYAVAANVPAGASSGPISVTNPAGSATSASDFTLTVPSGPVTFEEVQSGGSTSASSVSTTGSLTGVSGDLYLAAISTKPNVTVSDVSGLGLNWIPVRAQCSGRNQTGVAMWMAQGTPNGDGPVTAFAFGAFAGENSEMRLDHI